MRRPNQIAIAVFWDTCAKLQLTPAQYCVLFVLRQRRPISHNELGRCACLDRWTTSLVVRALRDRRLLRSEPHESDRRKTLLTLTAGGRSLLEQAERRCQCAARDLLSVFSNSKARLFVESLQKPTSYHEAHRREVAPDTVLRLRE
jgi:DNA-binding MarR family transcriptional regulator